MTTILFCEADKRILQAAQTLQQEGKNVLLVGDKEAYDAIEETTLQVIPIEPETYAQEYYERRKHKGITLQQAKQALTEPATYACMLLAQNKADVLIAGATWPTSKTLRPALQLLKKGLASSYFLMKTNKGEYYFADCALNIQPTSQELAQIAINTAQAAQKKGVKPKIAMLSFSTAGSAAHTDQEKVAQATTTVQKHIQENNLNWIVEGEIQVDAALNTEVTKQKNPDTTLHGEANILIFPDLDAANIGYKLVQQYTGCQAIGPIITGLQKEVHDLSRGCSAEEIVELARVVCE
ncbi:MAG: phosphotransacetylase [Candidatus Woesearchaeota archaeon]